MNDTTDATRPTTPSRRARRGTIVAALAVVAAATALIFGDLGGEPHFADESAMIAQSYYYTLFKRGQWNHPDWLHYAAFDHPPLPKYLFGLSLDLAGLPVPQNLDRWMSWSGLIRVDGRWVRSLHGGDYSPPADPRVLYWARVPAAIFGVGGAVAAFFVGLQLRGRIVGVAASLLLVANPLYLTHARRAMSDSFTECLVIAAVAIGLWGWRELWSPSVHWRRWLVFVAAQSLVCGLAVLAKLNGGLAIMVVMAMIGMGVLLVLVRCVAGRAAAAGRPSAWNLAIGPLAAAAIGAGSLLVFLCLNPFLTTSPRLGPDAAPEQRRLAHLGPLERARYLVNFRAEWSRDALANSEFQKDWLRTPAERMRMTLWEAFGRYSPLGPRDIRTIVPRPPVEKFSEYRRRASLVWFPLCVFGWLWAVRDGWRSARAGDPPQAWGLVLYTAAALGIVVLMIPLNWDRYYLPIQACSALSVPYGIAATGRWIASRLVLEPHAEPFGSGDR